MTAGKFLKYFILVVVALNIALMAYVFLGGLAPKENPDAAAATNSVGTNQSPR